MGRAAYFCSAVTFAASAFAWQSATAQTSASVGEVSAGPPPASATGQLTEIIVTAQRRSENVQSTPLAITALSGAQLAAKGLQNSLDLQQATPGLTYSVSANFSQPYIRGVGTDITTPGAQSSVATNIDGVYQASPYFGVQGLTEVDRVEVLKGPQGTLYGRNATGGVINIDTKDPSRVVGGEASVSAGNFGSVDAFAYVTGPITDTVSGNLLISESRHDGYGKVLNSGQSNDALDSQYIRAKLLYKPTDKLTILLNAQLINSYDSSSNYTYLTKFGATPLATVLGGKVTVDSYNSYSAYPSKDFTREGQISLKATYDLGYVHVTSLTAYTSLDATIFPSFVSTDIPIFDFEARGSLDRTIQQDILFDHTSNRYAWTAGFSFLDDSAQFDPIYTYSGAARTGSIFATVDHTAYSGFAELNYKLTERLSVIGGLRYTSDTAQQARLAFGDGDAANLVSIPVTQKSFGNATYKAVLQYSPDWGTLYGKYETGFKSGTVNAEAAAQYVEPEKLTSYEVGAKSELFERRLRLNGAAFYYDYSDLQSQYTDIATGGAYFETAKKATAYGAEFTADAVVTRDFTLSAGVNFLHTRFDNYISNGSYILIGGFETATPNLNLSGNELTHSPTATFNLGAEWRMPLQDGGNITWSGQYYFSSKYYFDVTNRVYQSAYSTLNGRVTWHLTDGRTSISLWARNLTDTKYLSSAAINAFGDYGQLAPPRTFGATLDYKY